MHKNTIRTALGKIELHLEWNVFSIDPIFNFFLLIITTSILRVFVAQNFAATSLFPSVPQTQGMLHLGCAPEK